MSSVRQQKWTRPRKITWALAGLLVLAACEGCTRRYFRQRADAEVVEVLAEKDVYPQWKIEQFYLYPDPRARFADPTNPDRPPMPPDDPAAWKLAPNPQKPRKAGVAWIEGTGYLDLLKMWDSENRGLVVAVEAEAPPVPAEPGPWCDGVLGLPLAAPPIVQGTPENPFLIKLEQAVELGLINSREYQNAREDLYLTALPVTLQRFSFAAQFFAASEALLEHTGDQTPQGHGTRWRLNSNAGFSKLFSTGALLLFSWANRTVINISGAAAGQTTSVSTLNLDLIQPLLQGGGRGVTLEPLTQAERNLLYQIRSYARFRKSFFVSIAAGQGVQRIGGGFGGLGGGGGFDGGIDGFGDGLDGFAGARAQVTPGAAGRLTLGTGGTAQGQGYLPTLLQAALIETARKNVARLEYLLRLFEALEEGGEVSELQVGQVELDLLSGRQTVIQREQQLRDALDRFKLQLGLPPPLPLALDDEPLDPVAKQLGRYEGVIDQLDALLKKLDKADAVEPEKLRAYIRDIVLQSELVQATKEFKAEFPARWAEWEKLTPKELEQRLGDLRSEVRKLLDLKADYDAKGITWPEKEQAKLAQLENAIEIGQLEYALRLYEAQPWEKLPDPRERLLRRAARFRDVRNAVALVLSRGVTERLLLLQAAWPTLPAVVVQGVDLLRSDLETAQRIVETTAIANRLDLMNARAQVHDAWRQILIFSNSLLGAFSVGYHLDSFTPPGEAQPLAFAASRTTQQLVLNAELPLVRVAQRNNYRASLIAYQRQRRSLMEAQDRVAAQVRDDLRQLRVLAETYAIQQKQVEIAFLQVESALETFLAPPDPRRIAGDQAAAASLTQQLLNAQRRLINAQEQLYRIWIDYQVNRLQLYFNLELMPLDFRGVWLDEIATCLPGSQESARAGAAHADGGQGGYEQLPPARILPPRESPPLEP